VFGWESCVQPNLLLAALRGGVRPVRGSQGPLDPAFRRARLKVMSLTSYQTALPRVGEGGAYEAGGFVK
jgi:hypothetical protein